MKWDRFYQEYIKLGGGFSMDFITIERWDEAWWERWSEVYKETFGETNAKPEKIIRNMFHKQMCFFHIAQNESEVQAIALSGKIDGTRMFLIDYLAVREKNRNQGVGRLMVEYISQWALANGDFDSIVIEVEAEKTPINLARIDFWIKCGFTLTEHIHHYRVVPEPYQAMFLKLVPNAVLPENGEELFLFIGKFHLKSFRGA